MKQNEYPYRNPALPLEERVEDLLGRMTLEEKVDQLMQITIGADTNPNNAGDGHSFRPTIGSVLSYSGGAKNRNAFQRLAVEHTRLGIPIIWGYDVIHGWRTGFPIPLAQACSWDPSLIEAGCRVAARESYAAGIDWTFSPMLDVVGWWKDMAKTRWLREFSGRRRCAVIRETIRRSRGRLPPV